MFYSFASEWLAFYYQSLHKSHEGNRIEGWKRRRKWEEKRKANEGRTKEVDLRGKKRKIPNWERLEGSRSTNQALDHLFWLNC